MVLENEIGYLQNKVLEIMLLVSVLWALLWKLLEDAKKWKGEKFREKNIVLYAVC